VLSVAARYSLGFVEREATPAEIMELAEFLVNAAPWLLAELFELEINFHHGIFGDRNPVERVFQDTTLNETFYNTFSRAIPESAEP
jgi:hypothetical protein